MIPEDFGAEFLTAGQMASLNRTTKKALRLYEQKGVLEPALVDPETGYRYYAYEQIPLLDTIQQMQAIGFTLAEMRDILATRDVDLFRAVLERRVEELERQSFEIEMAKYSVDRLLRSCNLCENAPVFNRPALEYVHRRKILRFPITPYHFEPRPSPENVHLRKWEKSLREIKRQFVDLGLPMVLFHNVGCIIARDHLFDGSYLVTDGFVVDPSGFKCAQATSWPEGYYLTVTIGSTRLENGDHAEYHWMCRLLEMARERGYEVIGDYFSDMEVESPLFGYEGRDMMMKLYLHVDIKGASAARLRQG